MTITLRFDEQWQGELSPVSLSYVPVFAGETLHFDKLLQSPSKRTSPLFIRFGDFDGEILRFDEAWQGQTSPLQLRFDGSDSGGGEPPAEPVEQVLGIAVGLGWQAKQTIEQLMALNSATSRADVRCKSRWQGDDVAIAHAVTWHSNPSVRTKIEQPFTFKKAVLVRKCQRWTLPASHRRQHAIAHAVGAIHDERNHNPWVNNKGTDCRPEQHFTSPMAAENKVAASYRGESRRRQNNVKYGPPPARYICTSIWADLAPKSPLTLFFDEPYQEYQSPITLEFDQVPEVCHWDNGGGFRPGSVPLPPLDFKIPIQPQIRRSYLMNPQISCVRLGDNLPIVLRSISIQQSRNQWAASCTIVFSSKGDAERAEGQTIKISINGYDFYMMVESLSSNRSFGNSSYSATGRGLLAELAAPYRKAVNFVNLTERSFMGLASDIVANTGWTVATEMTDFSVPANAWSYSNKTPAEALNTMATAIGAMLNVDAENRIINFVPKWPVSPWNTSSSTPDVALHNAVILEHSERHEMRTAANAVFVRGEQVGVAVKVKRTGSAGDEFADDVLDKLITDPQAARMRGSHELAEAGDKKQTQIRTKLMANLPPVTPGMLVGVTVDGSTYKATCDAWQLTAQVNAQGQVAVNQSLTLLRNAS